MNIPPHLKLFDSCVKPILLYCSEIWSLDSLVNNKSILENKYLLFPPVKMQLKFDKYLLGVKQRSNEHGCVIRVRARPYFHWCFETSNRILVSCHTANESLVHKAYEENLTLQNGTASIIKTIILQNRI
jgi:hypothetical protein